MKGCFKVVLILIWIAPVIFVEVIQIRITLSYIRANEAFLDTYFRWKDNTLFYIVRFRPLTDQKLNESMD